jgi:hypothetical protein
MLAEEYILIDISLSAISWCDLTLQGQLKYYSASAILFIFNYRAEVAQNISTAESPGRWLQLY